jgi:hypothetical protein
MPREGGHGSPDRKAGRHAAERADAPVYVSTGPAPDIDQPAPDEPAEPTDPADPTDVFVGMRVQIIENERTPPEMVRAEVILAQPDRVGVYDEVKRVLRKYGATPYQEKGLRLHNRAVLAFEVYIPEPQAVALAEVAGARWTTRVAGGGFKNSERWHMKPVALKFRTATAGQTADEFAPILRRGNVNILELSLTARPVMEANGKWRTRRTAVLELTVETDPQKPDEWNKVYAQLLQWAAKNEWEQAPSSGR